MHAIFAATGTDLTHFDRAVALHLDRGDEVTTLDVGSTRIGIVGADASIIKFQHDSSNLAIVALGSDLQMPGNRVLAQLAAGGPVDLRDFIAIRSSDGDLSAITGPAHHRLFTWVNGDQTFVSSCLRTAATAQAETTIDRSAEDFLLGFGFIPGTKTIYEGITTTDGGTVRSLSSGLTTPLEFTAQDARAANSDLHDELYSLLRNAIERRSAGSDHHAVMLGGFDSALVCALLVDLGKKVTAYTYDFEGHSHLNQDNIDPVVAALGIEHKWVAITPAAMDEAFATLDFRLNGPSAQPHYQLHTSIASEVIRSDGFDLTFNGDGADSAFLGYPTVSQRSALGQTLQKIPSPLRKGLRMTVSSALAERVLGHAARVVRSTLDASLLPWPASGHLPTRYLDDDALNRLRLDTPPKQTESVDQIRIRLAKGLEELDATRLAFNGNGMTQASRVKVEGAVAYSGVAHFSPFTEPELKAFASNLPTDQLRPDDAKSASLGKKLLSDMVLGRNLLPREVVEQPKQSPATSPIDAWLRGPLRATALSLIAGLPFDYSTSYVDELLKEKRVEDLYREKVTLSKHTLQAVGLLASYGAFTRSPTRD